MKEQQRYAYRKAAKTLMKRADGSLGQFVTNAGFAHRSIVLGSFDRTIYEKTAKKLATHYAAKTGVSFNDAMNALFLPVERKERQLTPPPVDHIDPEEHYTTTQVAAYLNLKPTSVAIFCKRGKMGGTLTTKGWRIPGHAVLTYKANHLRADDDDEYEGDDDAPNGESGEQMC